MRSFVLSTVILTVSTSVCWPQEKVYAPQFLEQVPSVVITDRLESGTGYDAPDGGWDGAERAESAFLFRYDSAIDLLSFVDVSGVEDPGRVRVAFTEYDNTEDLAPNGEKTLAINGKVALDKAPVTLAEFDESHSFGLGDGELDLRNIDFSPGNTTGPFDPVGDVTGESILALGEQRRVVTLHLSDQHLSGGFVESDKSFLVVTSLEGSDRVESEAEDFESLLQAGKRFDRDFSGWQVYCNRSLIDYPRNGVLTEDDLISSNDFSGVDIRPVVGLKDLESITIPGNPGEISLSTLGEEHLSQVGVFSLELPTTTKMEKGKIYEARVHIRSELNSQQGEVFVQMGNLMVSGLSTVGFKVKTHEEETELQYPGIGKQDQVLKMYILPKSTVLADDNTFRVQLVDFDESSGQDLYIDGMEILGVADSRDDLGKGTVVCDFGGDVSGEAEQLVSSVSLGGFSGKEEPGKSVRVTMDGVNKAVPTQNSVTDGALLSRMGFESPREEGGYITYSQFETLSNESLNLDELETGIETDPDCLYILDVYAKVDRPGQVLPNLAPFVLNDLTHLAGGVWKIGECSQQQATTLSRSNEIKLGVESKVYSVVFSPQTVNEKSKTCIAIQLFTAETLPNLTNATITIPRIRLTEYQ